MQPATRITPKKEESDDQPTFTEITIDVRPEDVATLSPNVRRF
jgi:twitching motility protein PilU